MYFHCLNLFLFLPLGSEDVVDPNGSTPEDVVDLNGPKILLPTQVVHPGSLRPQLFFSTPSQVHSI